MKNMARNKKSFIATMAIVLILILMATATFAWQQTAHKVNEFIGNKKGIILHDDFYGNTKDVYVENTGTGEIFIRIKLNETLKIGSNTPIQNWVTHKYINSAVDCGQVNNATDRDLFHSYFKWTMGGQKYYMPGSTDSSGTLSQDSHIYTSATPGAKLTPPINPATQIILWSVYSNMNANAKANYIGWIYDSDGYVYWSKPLQPDSATGLLLHGVTIESILTNREYYYAIDVIVEAVDLEDIPMWTTGAQSVDGSGKTYPRADHPALVTSISSFAALPIQPTALNITPAIIAIDMPDELNENINIDPEISDSEDNGDPEDTGDPEEITTEEVTTEDITTEEITTEEVTTVDET